MSRDLFLLAFAGRYAGIADGRTWEQCVYDHMSLRSVPVETLPGGYTVFGFASLSELQHQVDLTMGACDAVVILECKAYRGALPKNELLRFKAVTDDYYMALGASVPRLPVIRIFGGPGVADRELRRYAALHGIVVIDEERWPVPFLVADAAIAARAETSSLARLCRPLQAVLPRDRDGGYRMAINSRGLDGLLDAHDRVSAWYWERLDARPGTFEDLLAARVSGLRSVA
jgi:hypothetical protein